MHCRVPIKRKEKEAENIYEDVLIAKNFPNLRKETDIQVQKALRVPSRVNPKKAMQPKEQLL